MAIKRVFQALLQFSLQHDILSPCANCKLVIKPLLGEMEQNFPMCRNECQISWIPLKRRNMGFGKGKKNHMHLDINPVSSSSVSISISIYLGASRCLLGDGFNFGKGSGCSAKIGLLGLGVLCIVIGNGGFDGILSKHGAVY